MTMIAWNPSAEFERFFDRANERVGNGGAVLRAEWQPSVDIHENEQGYLIALDLPQVRAEDVEITVERGVLTVVGERKRPGEEFGAARHSERRFGRFRRSFQLPKSVDDGRIEARAKDGVLTLTVPKREEVKPRSIQVKVH
jgi:HSP20 family protein